MPGNAGWSGGGDTRLALSPVATLNREEDIPAYKEQLLAGLTEEEKKSIRGALYYFVDPEDVIPDHIPGIGFLDDAMYAEIVIKELSQYFEDKIVTEISPLDIFYEAEKEHQDYYKNNSTSGYCSFVINPKMQKLRQLHADKLK